MIQIILIVVLIILIYMVSRYRQPEQFSKTENKDILKYMVPKKTHDELERGLLTIHEIFNKHNIFYVVEGGTLLGAVRENNFILWDDDGDIAVWKEDQERIMGLKSEFEQKGYELSDTIHPRVARLILNPKTKYPFIDLFLYNKPTNQNDKLFRCLPKTVKIDGVICSESCCYLEKSVDWWWKNAYIMKDIFPRKLLKLGSIDVWGPNNPYPYIDGWYGSDALTTYKFTHDHNGENKTEHLFMKNEIDRMRQLY